MHKPFKEPTGQTPQALRISPFHKGSACGGAALGKITGPESCRNVGPLSTPEPSLFKYENRDRRQGSLRDQRKARARRGEAWGVCLPLPNPEPHACVCGSPAVLQQGHLPGDRGREGDTPATTWTVPASSAREQVGPRP